MKNGKMTFEEFESQLKEIKKANRPKILDYLERIKTEQTVQCAEDNENDLNLIKATDEILKKDNFASEHVFCNGVTTGSMTFVMGMLAMAAAPVVAAFSPETAKSYMKTIGTMAGGVLGGDVAITAISYKFHQACYNHELKRELKNHLRTKFSNQVKRDVDRGEVKDSVISEPPALRLLDDKDFIA